MLTAHLSLSGSVPVARGASKASWQSKAPRGDALPLGSATRMTAMDPRAEVPNLAVSGCFGPAIVIGCLDPTERPRTHC